MVRKNVTPTNMRTFLIIWIGQFISMLGSGLTNFGLAVWIFDQTGQATPFALTVMFGNIPRILLSPVAGALVDRWNRRRVMILADTGAAVITLGTFLLLLNGQLAIWHIYIIAILHACLGAFQEPAYTASITMLVPKKDLARASGMMQMGQALEMLITPLLAGILFVAIGLRGVIMVDFITFFFAVSALLFVHIPQPEKTNQQPDEEKQSVWQEARFGLSYLRARSGLFGLLLYFAMVNFFLNFSAVLMGPMVLSFSEANALGIVQAIGGIGMLIGSIAMGAWGGPQRKIPAVIGFIMLAAVGTFVAGLQSSVWVIGAGLFIMMFSIPFGSGMSQAVFQTKVAPAVQGRVFATRSMISRSMMPVAFLLAGPLADRVFVPLLSNGGALADTLVGQIVGVGPGRGIGLLFMASGLTLAIGTVFVWLNPRIRLLEDELPDAIPDAPAQEESAEGVTDTAVPLPTTS